MEHTVKRSNPRLNDAVLAALLIFLLSIPLSSAEERAPLSTLDIEASAPAYSQNAGLTISGRTKPLATIHAFINDVRVRVVTTQASGNFKLINMILAPGNNTLRLEAHEGQAVVTKEFSVIYDGTPPIVTLAAEIPQAVKANTITIAGDVNEKVTIKYRVRHRTDLNPPELVPGLTASKVEKNAVELAWEPVNASDLLTYLIERDGKRIASTTVTSFRDENLATNKPYAYSVAAVDSSCNIGTSAEASATTLSGGTNATPTTPVWVSLSCEQPYENTTAGSPFSLTLPLSEGYNEIELIFEDAAGNQEIIAKTVVVDNLAPKFLETNLDQISPSYIPDIKIKGTLNEQATVFVYINDETKPTAFEVTEPDGSFSIKVRLRTDRRIKKGATQTTVEVGEGFANKIKLEAVDLAGNKASHGPKNVNFLLCGLGTWWRADVGEALPSVLLPRLMIQGIQQIGIPFTLNYTGNREITAAPKVDVRPIPLSKDAEKDFDHDWVQVQDFVGKRSPRGHVGYIQVQFENVNPLPDDPDAGPNAKELALSDHRKGECLVPAAGCVKLFLQIEVQFQEKTTLRPADPSRPLPSPQLEKRTQKVCLPVEIAIDQTIPTDVIPHGLLRNAVKLIDKAINLIDKVLKPLTTIGEYVLYGCLGSNVVTLVQSIQETTACEGSQILNIFTGTFNKAVAEAGVCDQAYKDDAKKQSSCKACEKAIEARKKFETNVVHGLCDRIGCPSAPTFSMYIKNKAHDAAAFGDISAAVQKNDPAFFKTWAITGGQAGSQLYGGNDCAFTSDKLGNFITSTYKSDASRIGIRALYDTAKKLPSTEPIPQSLRSGPTAEDCKKTLHPAHPNCCGVQYQRDWSSACGIGTLLGDSLDLFDELKESTCLSAQQANIPAPDLKCNRIWNAVAGFCEKNTGQPTVQVVNTGAVWQGPLPTRPDTDGNSVYVFVVPEGFQVRGFPAIGLGQASNISRYRVFKGYMTKSFKGPAATTAQPEKGLPEFEIGGLRIVPEAELTQYFTEIPSDQKQARIVQEDTLQKLSGAFCAPSPDGFKPIPCEKQGNVKMIYERVNDIVGVSDTQYIVEPKSGLLRSVQCVCIPAVSGYLQMWRKVLGAFHGCFTKILMTGEGSPGSCAAMFSGTICDLFFEFISCFTQKFSTPGVGGRVGTDGFGDVLGAITRAGSDVSKRVNERYGDSPIYRSLFSERKLVHAICTWAFTGTWDLDISGLFQQQVQELPLDSEGALTTCQRTFISYDPTTNPSGLTTWAYRIAGGLIAGADLRYNLKLKCSSGFNCDPTDYPDGKCDCASGEKTHSVSVPELGSGLAKKYDFVNFDVPILVNPQVDGDSAGYRYDTAILEYEWTDSTTKQVRTGKVDCSIRETEGGNAPAFCALDAFSGKFRCTFGEQEGGIRMSDVKALYPGGQGAFGLGQMLNFSMVIKQKFPQARRGQEKNIKFLYYEIKDATGDVVKRKDNVELKTNPADVTSLKYDLGTDGVYSMFIPQAADPTPIGQFVLDDVVFQRHGGKATAAGPTQQNWGPGFSTSKKFVSLLTLVDNEGKRFTGTRHFIISFPNYKNDPLTYDVWMVDPGKTDKLTASPTNGWLGVATLKVLSNQKQLEGNLVNEVSFPLVADNKPHTGTLRFESVTGFPNANTIQILVTYAYTAQAAAAADVCKSKEALSWTATFTIYDADRGGNPSEQISTDPETEKQQKETITFNVQCAPPSEITTAQTCAKSGGSCGYTPAECSGVKGTYLGQLDCTGGLGCCKLPAPTFDIMVGSIVDVIKKLQSDEKQAVQKADEYLAKTNTELYTGKADIIAWLQATAKNERDANTTLTQLIALVKEDALKKSLQALTLLNALIDAAKTLEGLVPTTQGTLPGQAEQIRTALTTAKTTLIGLESHKNAALNAIQPMPMAGPPAPPISATVLQNEAYMTDTSTVIATVEVTNTGTTDLTGVTITPSSPVSSMKISPYQRESSSSITTDLAKGKTSFQISFENTASITPGGQMPATIQFKQDVAETTVNLVVIKPGGTTQSSCDQQGGICLVPGSCSQQGGMPLGQLDCILGKLCCGPQQGP